MLAPDFLGGVVEGFYGQAWTHEQRLHLFERMAAVGLNTYFYAPKNDLKHRTLWREPYTDAELRPLGDLVRACSERGINFIYGLSPGLDIHFSDAAERERIETRFRQMQQLGVRHFALLFDDLPGNLSEADRQAYPTLAAAQCDVTNAIHGWWREQEAGARFLFCPTPYCDRMDGTQLGGEGYLDTVGELLHAEIDVLWTGPEIVSTEIPVDSIERLTQRLRRRPVIWDNLFADDYDFSRCFCGPYSGRPLELRQALRGILINPNNEYPLNFVPLRTFAEYLHAEGEWRPRERYLKAVADWLPSYKTVIQPLALEDLTLLCDCFYLPRQEGPEAAAFLALVERLLAEPVDQRGTDYERFVALNSQVQALFERLTELNDRELFNAWSRRAWELKEELQVLAMVLAGKKAGYDIEKPGMLDQHHSGIFRRGFLTRLKQFVVLDSNGAVRVRPRP